MEVKFSEYRFQCEQLILYKQQEIIPLKHTQALLLDFFLSAPDAIHSKEAIMDAVWQDKVVSEQVVFQTISQLRAIFGSDAIKTFSKKGYQWQLLIEIEPDNSSELINPKQQEKISSAENKANISRQLAFATSLLLVFILVAIYLISEASTNKPVVLHLVDEKESSKAFQPTIADLNESKTLKASEFKVEFIAKEISARQSFSSPKRAWKLSNISINDWLLWTESYRSEEGIFLNYGLSSASRYWHGFLFAETEELLTQKLSERLVELEQLGIFSQEMSKLDISTLNVMIKLSPDDADLLLLLAKHYIEVKQYDVAITYAQKLVNVSSSYGFSPYRAKGFWLMAEVYSKRLKYQLASHALKNMSETLADTSLWPLIFEHIKAKSWLAYSQHDFDSMFAILDHSIEFGSKHEDALLQFELHILYSILAKKGGDNHKKYAYLNEAQALLLKHKLDESNFAVVYYHFAIFSQKTSNAVPYFEKILKLPRTANNAWIIDHSTELLIDQYIRRQDFELALVLLRDLKGSAKYMLSMARIYHAQQAPEKARSHFEKAFELARLKYEVHIGIDSALMLYQLSVEQPEIQAQYLDYLKRNANEVWLGEKLTELGIK